MNLPRYTLIHFLAMSILWILRAQHHTCLFRSLNQGKLFPATTWLDWRGHYRPGSSRTLWSSGPGCSLRGGELVPGDVSDGLHIPLTLSSDVPITCPFWLTNWLTLSPRPNCDLKPLARVCLLARRRWSVHRRELAQSGHLADLLSRNKY